VNIKEIIKCFSHLIFAANNRNHSYRRDTRTSLSRHIKNYHITYHILTVRCLCSVFTIASL